MNYILLVIALVAMVLSITQRKWTVSLIALGLGMGPFLLLFDSTGLFYHAIALVIISLSGMTLYLLLERDSMSAKSLGASILILLPYILICIFKALQLQGIAILRWTLLISILAFIYYTFERRKIDQLWFILLYTSLSAGLILSF